jgi:hypothetical protein
MKDAKGHGSEKRGGGIKPGPQTAAHPNAGNRVAFALRKKMAHDAGKDARLAAYAAAHGGKQAASANGARSPVASHAGVKSVGTHPARSGGGSGGGGGGGGGGSGGGRFSAKQKAKQKFRVVKGGKTP